MSITRRDVLTGALALGCSKRETPTAPVVPQSAAISPEASAPPSVHVLEWTMDPWPIGGGRAAALEMGPAMAKVLVPGWAKPEERFPLVIALHGRGEAVKGPSLGASGWPDDYGMVRAFDRMRHPPITAADLEDMVDEARVSALNARLASDGFRGVVVACPYLPDLDLVNGADAAKYASALIDVLIPRLRKEAPVIDRADATGIDGVSLGGITALRVGLANANMFGAVGAIQPAMGEWHAAELLEKARAARAKNPKLQLRLLTSTKDDYRRAVEALSRTWKSGGVEHEMAMVPGPHDYPFNRGPGVYELLSWHDRVLAR